MTLTRLNAEWISTRTLRPRQWRRHSNFPVSNKRMSMSRSTETVWPYLGSRSARIIITGADMWYRSARMASSPGLSKFLRESRWVLIMRIPCSDMVLMVIVLCRLRMSMLRWRMEFLPCGSRRLDQTSNPSGLRSREDAVVSAWRNVLSFQICIISRLRRWNSNSVSVQQWIYGPSDLFLNRSTSIVTCN